MLFVVEHSINTLLMVLLHLALVNGATVSQDYSDAIDAAIQDSLRTLP